MRAERQPRQILDIKPVTEPVPFPEYPDSRFEAIFPALGNSAAKCLALLSMETYPKTESQIFRDFMEASDKVWKTSPSLIKAYLQSTFVPIGMVAEVDTLFYGSSEYIAGYRTTNAGERFGKPIAAYLISKTEDLPISLVKIFGDISTGNGETMGALNRARILEVLNTTDWKELSVNSIAKTLGINASVVSKNIRTLQELGLVSFSSYGSSAVENSVTSRSIKYSLIEGEETKAPNPLRSRIKLTSLVIEIIRVLRTADASMIIDEIEKRTGKKLHPSNVSRVLADLSRQGILSSRFRGTDTHSKATITEIGRTVVSEIITPIRLILSDSESDLLEEWKQTDWKSKARNAVEKHKNESWHTNTDSLVESAPRVLEVIAANPGIRPIELSRILNKQSKPFVNHLLALGLITKERKRTNETRLYIVESAEKLDPTLF